MTDKINRTDENLMFKHGGYRDLKSYQMSTIIYDATVEFVRLYIDKFSRTNDQMFKRLEVGGKILQKEAGRRELQKKVN